MKENNNLHKDLPADKVVPNFLRAAREGISDYSKQEDSWGEIPDHKVHNILKCYIRQLYQNGVSHPDPRYGKGTSIYSSHITDGGKRKAIKEKIVTTIFMRMNQTGHLKQIALYLGMKNSPQEIHDPNQPSERSVFVYRMIDETENKVTLTSSVRETVFAFGKVASDDQPYPKQ